MNDTGRTWQFIRSFLDIAAMIREQACPDPRQSLPDISVRQYATMVRLWRLTENQPEGVPLKKLAEDLGLTPGTVSELVESLVRKDAIQRIPNPHDRRAVLITLTERSFKLIRQAKSTITELAEQMLAGVPSDHREILFEDIDTMLRILSDNKTSQQQDRK